MKSDADLIEEAYQENLKGRWETLLANVQGAEGQPGSIDGEDRQTKIDNFTIGCQTARLLRERAKAIVSFSEPALQKIVADILMTREKKEV